MEGMDAWRKETSLQGSTMAFCRDSHALIVNCTGFPSKEYSMERGKRGSLQNYLSPIIKVNINN